MKTFKLLAISFLIITISLSCNSEEPLLAEGIDIILRNTLQDPGEADPKRS